MHTTRQMIQQWKTALISEIQKLKEFEGRGHPVKRGKHLSNSERGATYWFVLSYPASLFPGASILFEYGGRKIDGSVLSSEGSDVIAELDTDLGSETGRGILHNEPWDLLNKLIARLEEIEEDPGKLKVIERVMNPDGPDFHPQEKVKSLVHEAVLRSKYNPVTYIWGPPGTGKTYTLARTAAYQYVDGRKILLLSHSNAAIDVLVMEMNRFLQKNNKWVPGEVIRYGFPEKEEVADHPDLSVSRLAEIQEVTTSDRKGKFEKKRLILKRKLSKRFDSGDSAQLTKVEIGLARLRDTLRKKEGAFVDEAAVIATTLSKAAADPLIYQKEFDLVIIDEASMAYTPQLAFAATLGSRVIICGDFRQLPPIAVSRSSAAAKWLKQDIFHLAGITRKVEKKEPHPHLMLLPVQRRMHPDISGFTNRHFYHSLVSDHPDTMSQRSSITKLSPFPEEAAVLLSISDTLPWCQADNGSRWNVMSTLVSLQLMLSASDSGMSSIGYVTPYRAQAKWVNTVMPYLINGRDLEKIPEVTASTVHKFQGSEKDMVIFDLTDGSPQERAGTLLTKQDSGRLINVSVTRAKGKFILVGDDNFIKQHVSRTKPVHQLIDYLKKMKRKSRQYDVLENSYTKRLKWFPCNDHAKLIKDIHSAKESVFLSFEAAEDIEKDIWEALSESQNKKSIIILCKQTCGIPLENYKVEKRRFLQPFIGLDKKVLWFGKFKSVRDSSSFPYMARVFSGKFYAEYDTRQTDTL